MVLLYIESMKSGTEYNTDFATHFIRPNTLHFAKLGNIKTAEEAVKYLFRNESLFIKGRLKEIISTNKFKLRLMRWVKDIEELRLP